MPLRWELGTTASVGAATAVATSTLGLLWWWRATERAKARRTVRKDGPLKGCQTPDGAYDVVIVGAGPAGSTIGYYLAKGGLRVALLERKQFPRQKLCGDAWCEPAIAILEDMGVWPKILADKKAHLVQRGGFISPSGFVCVNNETQYGDTSTIRTAALKREDGDEYIARAAEAAGAELYENAEVQNSKVRLKTAGGGIGGKLWDVPLKDGRNFKGRLLCCCDGSTSYLAQELGIVPKSESQGVCTNQYIQSGTHHFSSDGVMIFTRALLPGYSALFKHSDGDMYLGTYILPGGRATSQAIKPAEGDLVARHFYVQGAFGSTWSWRKKPQLAPIRLGGVKQSSAEQCLVVGDSAGQVDPLTGEGIHTAMIAAQIAAKTALEMFKEGSFDLHSCEVYHHRWLDKLGFDFACSAAGARLLACERLGSLALDAVAKVGARRGQAFLDEFGRYMTGVSGKQGFLRPGLSVPIAFEVLREFVLQYLLWRQPRVPTDMAEVAVQRCRKKA